MLKQVFDKEQLSKALSSSDVWKWGLLSNFKEIEDALDYIVEHWKKYDVNLSSLKKKIAKKKPVFIPADMKDAFAIKLLDRFIRRIYKVRQSDRNRIIRQLITLLKDSGNYHIIRLDIKDCYETIKFEKIISKFEDELILSPECIKLLRRISNDLQTVHGVQGLPRGLSISPTLAELYLENLDKRISSHPDVIYSARYVDDIIILTPANRGATVHRDIENFASYIGLAINENAEKQYSGPSDSAEFEYLGYSIKVKRKSNAENKVNVTISESKAKRIKTRIALALYDHKKQNNMQLLKRRLEYISMLKRVRKSKNGDLLAGIAHNYQYVTDEFECLKPLDGFLLQQLANPRFQLNQREKDKLRKISIYGNARKKKIGKFGKKQNAEIMRVWQNA